MQAHPLLLCLSVLVRTSNAGFLNPIGGSGALVDAGGPVGLQGGGIVDSGMSGGVIPPVLPAGGIVDSRISAETGVDVRAGGSGTIDASVDIPVPSVTRMMGDMPAEMQRGGIAGMVDSNLIGGRMETGFPGDGAMGGFQPDPGMIGGVDMGMGVDMPGIDAADATMAGMDTGTQGGRSMGFLTGGTGVKDFGMDMGAVGEGAGMTSGLNGEIRVTNAPGDAGTTVAQGSATAGVSEIVPQQQPSEKDANEAAALLRGLMKETSGFDAASEPTAPGAVEPHSMVAGPPSIDALDRQPIVGGDVPKGGLMRTVTEEKSTFSVSGESSFESFSSSGVSSSDAAGSNLVDLNPIAAGANVLEPSRGMRDFPGEGAAAAAVDANRKEIAAAGSEQSASGAVDGGMTATDGATGVLSAGVIQESGAVGGIGASANQSVTGAANVKFSGPDVADAGIQTGATQDVGFTGDMSAGTGTAQISGGVGTTRADSGSADPTEAGAHGQGITNVDISGAGMVKTGMAGDVGANMGVDLVGMADTGFMGTGEAARAIAPDTRIPGDLPVDTPVASAVDLSATGPEARAVVGTDGTQEKGFMGAGEAAGAVASDTRISGHLPVDTTGADTTGLPLVEPQAGAEVGPVGTQDAGFIGAGEAARTLAPDTGIPSDLPLVSPGVDMVDKADTGFMGAGEAAGAVAADTRIPGDLPLDTPGAGASDLPPVEPQAGAEVGPAGTQDAGFVGVGEAARTLAPDTGIPSDLPVVSPGVDMVGKVDTGFMGAGEAAGAVAADTRIPGDFPVDTPGASAADLPPVERQVPGGTQDAGLIGVGDAVALDSGIPSDLPVGTSGTQDTAFVGGGGAEIGTIPGDVSISGTADGSADATAAGGFDTSVAGDTGASIDVSAPGATDLSQTGPSGDVTSVGMGEKMSGAVGAGIGVDMVSGVDLGTGTAISDASAAEPLGTADKSTPGIAGTGIEGIGTADSSFTSDSVATADTSVEGSISVPGDMGLGVGVDTVVGADTGVTDGTPTALDGTADIIGPSGTDTAVTSEDGVGIEGTGTAVGATDSGFTGDGRTAVVDVTGAGIRDTVVSGDTGADASTAAVAGEMIFDRSRIGMVDTLARRGGMSMRGGIETGVSADRGAEVDPRVRDAMSLISGQMNGAQGRRDDSFSTGGVKQMDVGANVLDTERGMRDFQSSGAASTLGETRKPSGGIFDWTGEADRSRNLGMVVGGAGVVSGSAGSVTGDGSSRGVTGDASLTMEGTRRASMTGDISGGKGSVSIDKAGAMSASGASGDASLSMGGTRSVSVKEESSGMVPGDASMSVSRSGQLGVTGAIGDASVSAGGSRSITLMGERRDSSLSFDATRFGTVSMEKSAGLSGGGVVGGRTDRFGTGNRMIGDRGSAGLSLEERTVRQGEWSATWNYEGAVPEWFRHRVDPAPCRHFNCNLASCYVPNPNDCKSYIVCQQTALGTYVATRMRCAFGTYWTASNIWTCERIDDKNLHKFNCPNDPCRDPQLARYPDEDFNNCRSFWTCIDGRSKPECCPPGQRFDRETLNCVDDPTEICREPCPLKTEGCSAEGPKKQPFYDGNCLTYWDCGRHGAPHPVCCPEGHSFEPGTGTCIRSGCQDTCPPEYSSNVCGKVAANGQIVKSYDLKDNNCRTFMKCGPDGERIAYCCRSEHFYNPNTMRCEKITDLLDPCRVAICPDGYKEECRFEAVEDPHKMYDIDADLVRDCAQGTVFDLSICTCVFSKEPFRRVCKKEVDARFDQPKDKWSVKNYGDGWISTYNAMIKNVTKNGNYYAAFEGTTGMEVWRYDHNVFKEVTMKLTFQPVNARDNKRQILVSNCQTTEQNGGPSFEVTLHPDTSMIRFTGRTETETAVVELQYNKTGWNTYTLLFDGENVLAMIEDPNALGKADSSSTRLKGELIRGMGPLIFGPCRDSRSKPNKDGFVGFMSEVIFAKCLDEASKLFMKETLETSMARPI